MEPLTTAAWALSHHISVAPTLEPIEGYDKPYATTARQIATRAVILQGVVAVASEVDSAPVVDWYHAEGIWDQVSPMEQAFLLDPNSLDRENWNRLRWRQEAEWALLWSVGKVDELGLPTHQCDMRRLCDELIPALGSDIEPFLDSSELRPPGMLLAEVDRHYNLWCQYCKICRTRSLPLPTDLQPAVLFQREDAFEWLSFGRPWDDVRCDA